MSDPLFFKGGKNEKAFNGFRVTALNSIKVSKITTNSPFQNEFHDHFDQQFYPPSWNVGVEIWFFICGGGKVAGSSHICPSTEWKAMIP